jgi:hypothetical protein
MPVAGTGNAPDLPAALLMVALLTVAADFYANSPESFLPRSKAFRLSIR